MVDGDSFCLPKDNIATCNTTTTTVVLSRFEIYSCQIYRHMLLCGTNTDTNAIQSTSVYSDI